MNNKILKIIFTVLTAILTFFLSAWVWALPLLQTGEITLAFALMITFGFAAIVSGLFYVVWSAFGHK